MSTNSYQDSFRASSILLDQSGPDDGDVVNGVYLSVDSEMKPTVTLGQGFPATFNELPVHYRDVQATVCGHYTHPVTGQPVVINAARVRNLAKNVNTMLSRKIDVPASKTHKYTNPDNTLGNVFAAREKNGELVLTVGYYGDDSLNVAQRNKVSLGLCSNYTDSQGNVYDDTINHLAITPVPVLPGLPGFVTLSRGEPTEATTSPLAPSLQEGVDMLDPALKERVTQYLSADAIPENANEVVPLLLSKLDELKPKAESVTQLSRDLDDAKAKIVTLSKEEEPVSPRVASALYKAAKAEVSTLGLSRASQDAILGLVEIDGKPNVTLLSREDDAGSITFDRVIEVVKVLAPSLLNKERTGIQTLSRETPDDDAAGPLPFKAMADRFNGVAQ